MNFTHRTHKTSYPNANLKTITAQYSHHPRTVTLLCKTSIIRRHSLQKHTSCYEEYNFNAIVIKAPQCHDFASLYLAWLRLSSNVGTACREALSLTVFPTRQLKSFPFSTVRPACPPQTRMSHKHVSWFVDCWSFTVKGLCEESLPFRLFDQVFVSISHFHMNARCSPVTFIWLFR